MLHVDDRIGSRELAPMLAQLIPESKVRVARLDYGDFSIYSRDGGPDDSAILVGVERKRIRDMISSMESGRYAGSQLPGMLNLYDTSYLIVEGYYRPDSESGCLQLPAGHGQYRSAIWKSRVLDYRALDAFLNTMRMKTPVQVIKTRTPQETAMELYILWHWYTSKRWSQHGSHLRFPSTPPPATTPVTGQASAFRRMVKELPYIGWERSFQVERVFGGDILNPALGNVADWCLVDGITPTRAMEIVKALRGRR